MKDFRGWRTDLTQHAIDLEELIRGCPERDCIPAIDRPLFTNVEEADLWLESRSPVAVLRYAGESRAYPLQILIRHEIVNDQLGDAAMTITYCPLCNTTIAFDRHLGNHLLDFGVSGYLRRSDLVMYDRQTESFWQQATGQGIVGKFTGRRLTPVSAPVLSWRDFKADAPQGLVLSRDTGYPWDYQQHGFAGYDSRPRPLERYFHYPLDERLPAMERVAALSGENGSLAIPFSALAERRVMNIELDERPLVVFWAPGTASMLDTNRIDTSQDVGAAAVFSRTLGEGILTFRASGEGSFVDEETSSSWTIAGRALAGPLAGAQLTGFPHTDAFWFSWASFYPTVRIVRE